MVTGLLPSTFVRWQVSIVAFFNVSPFSSSNILQLRKVPELARPLNESKADKKDPLLESNILQLRKVSEIVKPSDKPKANERDALLEQIRNKVGMLCDNLKIFSHFRDLYSINAQRDHFLLISLTA